MAGEVRPVLREVPLAYAVDGGRQYLVAVAVVGPGIAVEVFAAVRCDRSGLLYRYVAEARRGREVPLVVGVTDHGVVRRDPSA